jgi:tetratricopeptide (TPR) repeat protein
LYCIEFAVVLIGSAIDGIKLKQGASMSHFYKICPRCLQNLAEERARMSPSICDSCGYVLSVSEFRSRQRQETSFTVAAVLFSLFLVGAFVQIGAWGNHAIQVLPLQVGELLGMNSAVGREQFAQIALEVKQYDVVERLYIRAATQDAKLIFRLAKFQIGRGKIKEAINTLRHLQARGNMDYEARYLLARSLGEVGNVDEASTHYELVLRAKPSVRQTTVLTNYVRMLMTANRLDEARRVIDHARRKDDTAFMETEYMLIVARLEGKT